jgi:hypothetical protein
MAGEQMRNPFRKEEDAFRVLVIIVVAAAIVIASAVLISRTLGAILAAIAITIGLWKTVGWLGSALGEPDEEQAPSEPPPTDDRPGPD